MSLPRLLKRLFDGNGEGTLLKTEIVPKVNQSAQADQSTNDKNGNDISETYLARSGDILTGNIIVDSSNTTSKNIDIGHNWNQRTGSGLGFRGSDHTDHPGGFSLYARNASNLYDLKGYVNGSLTWNGKEIERVLNKKTGSNNGYLKLNSGFIIQWIALNASASGATFTWPTPLTTSESFVACATRRSTGANDTQSYNVQAKSTTQSTVYGTGYCSIIAITW